MTDLMFGEFAKYQVLPLDASVATRLVAPRPNLIGRPEGVHLFRRAGHRHPAGTRRRTCSTRPTRSPPTSTCRQGGAEGMIVTDGGRFGGYGLYLLKGKPVFTWNLLDLKRVRWEGAEALAPGKHTLGLRLQV